MKVILTFPKEYKELVIEALDKEIKKIEAVNKKMNSGFKISIIKRLPAFKGMSLEMNLSYQVLSDTQIKAEYTNGAEKYVRTEEMLNVFKSEFDKEFGEGKVAISLYSEKPLNN